MERQQDSVLRQVEEANVDYIRLWFTDVVGTLKSVVISPTDLETAFDEGLGIDGSTIEGLTRTYESDMLLAPDPSTFRILPEYDSTGTTGVMMSDVLTPDGEPAASDPRGVLKRALERAERMGLEFFTHPEIEFYLFEKPWRRGEPLQPIDDGGYFDYVQRPTANNYRRELISQLESMNIHVEYSHHEGGPGQNEVDLRYADALATADNILTMRAMTKKVAHSMGQVATFMPKPIVDQPGSGMHTHLSLFQNGKNVFHEPGAEYGLSKTARHFIAGLLRHAPEYSVITNQFVNSYKRLWGKQEAPSFICWGHNNRSALVRVPYHKPTKGTSSRVEFRGLDSAANPYLAFAVLLGAGIAGIEGEYDLPEGAEDTVWDLTDRERRAMGIEPLPSDLYRALDSFEDSELMAEILGEEVFEFIIRNKHDEWAKYRNQVTDSELASTFNAV
ncbi:glutamine synthetase family protein [Helcobacillus massiliensis]|uniref:Glutamine synthetase n=1 Tax=Helcobacillus massiliensis TaxID=521392 RepID=A0A839QS43_9MICO|nr:glutamine synthetase family protein [Helcobacillus massiliensis]MBB3022488.1 glutamine synthetase [Helcobacillus massiliensis]MDK7741192.1 glutamine synthetase family protein [Helcobacillus massiliensis]WOO93998.1 glutamine synthetase family protein [Helcobacillus massiliensis]